MTENKEDFKGMVSAPTGLEGAHSRRNRFLIILKDVMGVFSNDF
jgi:hypothetical protein